MNDVSAPTVTVIVISYNGARRLAATLTALTEQDFDKGGFTIVVVDDGSTDRTADVAHDMGVRVVRLDRNSGPGYARNAGLRVADTDVVAYIDDDCVAAPNWLHDLIAPFDNLEVDGVGGYFVQLGLEP